MLGTGKVEFPPLLSAGFHEMLLPALRQLCVDGFPLSTTRAGLMGGIEAICASLSTALIPASVWINGSFMTQKIDPNDVDLAVKMRAYWQRQFGFSRNDEFKGVAVIRTPFA